MAQSKRPRKKYTPKPSKIPVAFRFGAEDERDMQMYPHLELTKLRNGCADDGTWHTITCRLNIGQTVAHMGNYPDSTKALMRTALDAVRSVYQRHEEKGVWGVTGDELAAIGAGLDVTDELQKVSTRRLLRDAIKTVYREAAT